MAEDTHFLTKLVFAAPCSLSALAASLQHFLVELVSAAPCRFFGPIWVWQLAPASAPDTGAAAGAGAAGAGAAGAGAGGFCASAEPAMQSEATTSAMVFMVASVRIAENRPGVSGSAIRRSGSPCRRSPAGI